MKSTLTKVLASAIIIAATVAAIAITYKAHGAEPERGWKMTEDKPPSGTQVALSVEREGERVVSITVYDADGDPALTVLPDGNVDIHGGRKPEEAAQLFWATVARYVSDCSKSKP